MKKIFELNEKLTSFPCIQGGTKTDSDFFRRLMRIILYKMAKSKIKKWFKNDISADEIDSLDLTRKNSEIFSTSFWSF